MQPDQTPFDLLAHFDRPKTVDGSTILSVAGVERSEPPASTSGVVAPKAPKRDIRWVFKWAAAMAVLAAAAGVLAEFTYVLGAEHKLAMAARAGVMEATLPDATYQSVTAAVERRLNSYPLLTQQLQINLTQNDFPAPRQLRQSDGDRFTIMLAAPNSSALPRWLRTIMPWLRDSQIRAQAEKRLPSRKLPTPGADHAAAE